MSNGVPVFIETKAENEFKLTKEELLANLSSKTKAVILPYPCNPTGAIMEKEDLEAVAQVVKEKDLFVFSDVYNCQPGKKSLTHDTHRPSSK